MLTRIRPALRAGARTLSTAHSPQPTEIKLSSAQRRMTVSFDDNSTFVIPVELLRVESPSAAVQGHSAGERKLVPGRRHVNIMKMEPVGNYAVRLVFDDMHDSGIYSWDRLYEMGKHKWPLMRRYITEMRAAGLSRDPPARRK